ncbi:hypothetical protein FB451DRAFT_1298573 [Mycena latifolia]|nr:hypothetical protein FB451DRAFT_1298573 [Mycena latifolia]
MEDDTITQGASAFQTAFDKSDGFDGKDPAVVAQDLAAQTSFLRKLKFQYLEQNAKAKYITAIVSDIDDAAIVTAEDYKALALVCDEKERLRVAKAGLAEVRTNIRTLPLMVEQDYAKLKESAAKAALLTQKIIDARLALTRLRHAHPQPRLTIRGAQDRLAEQVQEMQVHTDDIEQGAKKVQNIKGSVKSGTQELDPMVSFALHRSVFSIHDSQSVSENEVRLTYIFGLDVAETVESHIRSGDGRGLIVAVLAMARAAP